MLLLATKLKEKTPDPHSSRKHYQSFISKKNTKSVKQTEVTYQPKTFENPKIVDIKSVITENPKTWHKLSKPIRQAEKVSQVGFHSSLYSDTKNENFFNKINVKIIKRAHAFKGYENSYNVEILNSSNPVLQIKVTEPKIKNKFKKWLTESRRFKFVATLVLVFKKIESDYKTKYDTFYSSSKAQIMMYLNQLVLQLYQRYKNF